MQEYDIFIQNNYSRVFLSGTSTRTSQYEKDFYMMILIMSLFQLISSRDTSASADSMNSI